MNANNQKVRQLKTFVNFWILIRLKRRSISFSLNMSCESDVETHDSANDSSRAQFRSFTLRLTEFPTSYLRGQILSFDILGLAFREPVRKSHGWLV